ncbi:hypothetical protein B5C34_08135 [Pacificimonas flava]|uniref:site-specific DNA-methyltransferase (adenine-specific) n=2 Tax=Pacificimonas TaxID=1960290 RepID=A0A219B4W4_9SPHN|nr:MULTISPECIES: site-specific DNA-methyltransferase [Pacificimonas]MBZ6379370.1 site-specific DNA-methyltransferase [Pacificimonas aurantium]OWV33432.1 hypothetical protein B5C34_08135 [Pacificimonas flava]
MPNVEKQRERLISLLKELFQLDQPDLDFGFYRIMHAKAGQVTKFLEEDLLGIIRNAFGEADGARVEKAKAAYEAARKQAEDFGAPDPDAAPKVKEAKAAWDAAKDSGSNEGDVYDHLYRFFERYYDNGDFISRRYFARETDGKAAPYAVPYDGREVYLHWANRDQYYIKTSEYLTNFTFDPTQAKEFKGKHGALFEQKPLKVHCRIVSASEGEHNNVKASEQTERYFIIHEPEPVKIVTGDTGEPELVIQFQYRPDPEKTGQEGTWRKKRLAEAADKVKALLPKLEGADDYVTALMTPAPTEAEKDRTLLEKYLAQYTGRNTMDYFIHKDLGGFLRRELDFYIKNEVMRLDDIESADAPLVEVYLAKVKVLRRIAQHLIDFLAQLEDFQKRLWLKKKFVVDAQYCITLDRIPEEFYPEIAANKAQREEWSSICDFPKSNSLPKRSDAQARNLVLDTAYFSAPFVEKLVSKIDVSSEALDGLLVNSENSDGLNIIRRSTTEGVKSIYIDPPFNTGDDGFVYKDNYPHSSWLSLIRTRLTQALPLLDQSGAFSISIGPEEIGSLRFLCDDIFGETNRLPLVTVKRGSVTGHKVINPGVVTISDYLLTYAKKKKSWIGNDVYSERERDVRYNQFIRNRAESHTEWSFCSLLDAFSEHVGVEKRQLRKHFGDELESEIVDFVSENADAVVQTVTVDRAGVGADFLVAVDRSADEPGVVHLHARTGNPDVYLLGGKKIIFYADKLQTIGDRRVTAERASDIWLDVLPNDLHNEGGVELKKGKKPEALLARIIEMSTNKSDVVLDFFLGSGTASATAQKMGRKWIGIEAAAYFREKSLARMKQTLAGDARGVSKMFNWKGGGAFKYLRLETYEDALNNLAFRWSPTAFEASRDFARDYMLRYWLDFETKGSPSLLNIEWFDDPTAYKLKIKKPGTDEYVEKAVDLVETFNWLIGLHVEHLDRWRGYDAAFKREVDPELPEDTNTRLMLDGALKETDDGAWRFRKVEGYTLRTPGDHNDREKALVVWRKLTGDLEQDNLMLDEWFRKYRLSAQDTEFDVIYVNGSNNLPNLRKDEETWKVRLIEEAFHQAMWDVEG